MAGQVSKENLGSVLMQAMLATKNLRPLRDRLLQLRRRFQEPGPGDDAAGIQMLASDLCKEYFISMEAGARMLFACLKVAKENGARIAFNTVLAVIPDEQQYDVLLSQRLPAHPTTQAQAFSLVDSAFNALRLAQAHHMPRCIELLAGHRPPNLGGEVPRVMFGYPDDPVAAAKEHIAKNGLPILAKASPADTGTREATGGGKVPQAASSIDVDQALTYLHRACTLVSLAVSDVDFAVEVISSFLDPEKVASVSNFTDRVGYISKDGKRCHHPTDSD